MLSKHSSQLPTYIPYMDMLPSHVRNEIFSLLKRPLELNRLGRANIKVFLELILDQFLDADYGEPEIYGSSMLSSKRCAALGHVIYLCK